MPSQKITSMKEGMKLFFSGNFQHCLSLDPCYPAHPSYIFYIFSPYSCYRQSEIAWLAWIVWREKCPHSQVLRMLRSKSKYVSFQCYMFHMNVGVRAGGGIGDEIVDPAGDEFEVERVLFDVTFFFFVVVILLAIIQGEPRSAWEHVYHTNTFRSPCLTRIHLMNVSCGSGVRIKCLFHWVAKLHWHVLQRRNPVLLLLFFLGLIIDAFGELRDQQEQVKEDMEVRFDTLSLTYTR